MPSKKPAGIGIVLPPVKQMKVNVTDYIIAVSRQNDQTRCLVAQDLRIHHGAWSIRITEEGIYFNLGQFRYHYPLPAHVAKKIKAFDEDRTSVKPFSFWLQARNGFVRPVEQRSPRGKHKKGCTRRKKYEPCEKRCTVRRYHGLAAVGGNVSAI
jgi:hypothetical protein